MVRLTLILTALLLAGGCAHRLPPATAPSAASDQPGYSDVAASALAFNPPISAGVYMPDLTRDGRDTSAFAGFQTTVDTFFWIRTDDQQSSHGDRYDRWTIMQSVGFSRR